MSLSGSYNFYSAVGITENSEIVSMKSVIILLSTYNGEKYLREQIDSLLNQQEASIRIMARDDGSVDSTLSILAEYADLYPNFSFYQGSNFGPANSFFNLIKNAESADYYALCDQDDVWDVDKMSIAIQNLERYQQDKPNVYYSNLRVVDEQLNYYRNLYSGNHINNMNNKYSALIENYCTGCTVVFNGKAKDMIADNLPDYCTMHDAWIFLVCMFFGNVIYDPEAHISYRQHGHNVIGANLKKGGIMLAKEKILRLFNRDLQPRLENAKSLYKCFGQYLNQEDTTKVLEIINYKNSIKNRLILFFDNDIKASTIWGNLRYRFHILWGTL